jgi:hypothetical protein
MRRSRRKLIGALAAAAVLAGALAAWPRPQARFSQEAFNRIRLGMSYAEVETLLGPPGDFRSGPTVRAATLDPDAVDEWGFGGARFPPGMGPTALSGGYWILRWETDAEQIRVLVMPPDDIPLRDLAPGEMPPGGVIEARISDMQLEHGPFENFLWRLKRQWRKWFPE